MNIKKKFKLLGSVIISYMLKVILSPVKSFSRVNTDQSNLGGSDWVRLRVVPCGSAN